MAISGRIGQMPMYSLFFSKYFLIGFLALVLQQAIVAASVYFLAAAVESISTTSVFVTYFVLYVFSLVTPYVPGIFSHYNFDLWAINCVKYFQDDAIGRHPFKPIDYVKSEAGAKRNALFSNTVPAAIYDFCYYTLDLISTFLNSTLSIAVIAALIDYRIALSYLFSLIACAVYTRFFSDLAKTKTEQTEIARVELLAHTERLWPNLVISNLWSLNKWQEIFEGKYQAYFRRYSVDRKVRYGSELVLSLICVVPSALTVLYIAVWSEVTTATISAILVTTPRVFQLLTMLGQFSSLIFGWSHVKGRLAAAGEFFDPVEGKNPVSDLQSIEIWRDQEKLIVTTIDGLIDEVKSLQTGRLLVQGANGTGKTTLLLSLKQKLGHQAFYLPPSSQLVIDVAINSLSTGQTKIAEIEALFEQVSAHFCLLDEWDANLDPHNLQIADQLIAEAAKNRVVIEVRHRH